MARTPTLTRVAAITATLHHGNSMIVLNAGKPVRFAATSLEFLEDRRALEPESSQAKAAAAPAQPAKKAPAGKGAAKPPADPALVDARKRYKDVFGKQPGPRDSVAQIEAKIAAKQAEDAAASGGGGASGDGEEQAPA